MSSELANWTFFLGKMEALRYPVVIVHYGGTPCLAYPKVYIDELLADRQTLMTSRVETPTGEKARCTTG